MTETKLPTMAINLYRHNGVWHGARWSQGEYDGCDALDIPNDATEAEATERALTMPLLYKGPREIVRVPDIND